MSKSQKPRRPYSPQRWLARTQAVQQKRLDAVPLLADRQRDLGLNAWIMFEQMMRGGNESAWNSLAQTINICLVLCELGIGAEYEQDIRAAQDALMRISYRQQHKGSWAMDAEGMAAIEFALRLHDKQMEIAERGEIRQSINTVNARLKAGNVFSVEAV